MRTQSARLLHGYHYVPVDLAEQPAMVAESGKWLAAIGVIVMLLGPARLLPQAIRDVADLVLVVALFVCIWMTCRIIMKYNGSLFG